MLTDDELKLVLHDYWHYRSMFMTARAAWLHCSTYVRYMGNDVIVPMHQEPNMNKRQVRREMQFLNKASLI